LDFRWNDVLMIQIVQNGVKNINRQAESYILFCQGSSKFSGHMNDEFHAVHIMNSESDADAKAFRIT
jgi:hypothetical protein